MIRRGLKQGMLAASFLCAALPAHAQFAISGAAAPQRPVEMTSPLQSIVFPKPQPPVSNAASEQPTGAAEQDDPAFAQALGCVIAGVAGTSVAMAAGSENVVNIVAGGLVAPVNRIALYTAVVGVVFGTFCAVGQAMTPIYLHLMKKGQNNNIALSHAAGQSDRTCARPASAATSRDDDFSIIRASFTTPAVAAVVDDFSTPASFLRKR